SSDVCSSDLAGGAHEDHVVPVAQVLGALSVRTRVRPLVVGDVADGGVPVALALVRVGRARDGGVGLADVADRVQCGAEQEGPQEDGAQPGDESDDPGPVAVHEAAPVRGLSRAASMRYPVATSSPPPGRGPAGAWG